MSVNLGQAVKYIGGNNELIGRVCKLYASGFCCVQFEAGCIRVRQSSLQPVSEPAPICSAECTAGVSISSKRHVGITN